MSDKKCSIDKKKKPKESHKTAAWADESKKDPKTNMSIPSDESVEEAKEWTEENKK